MQVTKENGRSRKDKMTRRKRCRSERRVQSVDGDRLRTRQVVNVASPWTLE